MTQLPDNLLEPFGGPNIAHVATLFPTVPRNTVPVWVGIEAGRFVSDLTALMQGTQPQSRSARGDLGYPARPADHD